MPPATALALPASPAVLPRGPRLAALAWRQLGRDFRAGELRLLIVAVMLAVAALTAVGFFADRLNSGLARDARSLLGGDAIVAGDQPVPAGLAERARAEGLAVARTVSFPSMGRASETRGGASRLVAVKAVSEGYPLRGALELHRAAGASSAGASPAQGEAGAQRVRGAPPRGGDWGDEGNHD